MVSPGYVGASASINGGVPIVKAEAAGEARGTILAAEGGLCAGVTDNMAGFDGSVGVVACLGLDAPP